ncbi:MAG: carbonic anhydrase family protein [Cyanobacteria bacterium J083]|nr:MAG: carbonic anhydrase family protein [Cyanobacteria bacterium J083]
MSIITSLGLFYAPAILAGEDSPSWSYGGADNPTQWGRLGDDFAACELGRDQSPIDINIDEAIKSTPAKIEFNYSSVPLVVVNNGHTAQVNYQPGSSVKIDGEEYELLQFHFHTPSEHTVSEKASAMELHLVHRNSKGELAVIGVMMEEGLANPFIDKIWQHIPLEPRVNEVEKMTFNAQDLLPKDISYVSYAGSLTTPPCSEGVKWHVLTEAIEVSPTQIANFQKLYQVNARPIQPLNGRTIKLRQQ